METAEHHELAAAIRDVHEIQQQLQQAGDRLEAVYHRLTGLLDDDDLAAVEADLLDLARSATKK